MKNNFIQNVIFTFDKSSSLNIILRNCELPILIITDDTDKANENEKKLLNNRLKIINLTKNISFAEKLFIKKNLAQEKFDIIICDNFSINLFANFVRAIVFEQNYFSIDDYFKSLNSLKDNFENLSIYLLINPVENIKYFSNLSSVIDAKIVSKIYNLIYDYQKVALGSNRQ